VVENNHTFKLYFRQKRVARGIPKNQKGNLLPKTIPSWRKKGKRSESTSGKILQPGQLFPLLWARVAAY
jgi:hypothetical protein